MQKSFIFFILKPSKAIFVFIIIVCISIATALAWSIFAPIDEVINSNVLLRPNTPISSVKCINSGQIYAKNYINGTEIKAGDLLFRLDTTVQESELEKYKKELIKNQQELYINEILLQTIETETLPYINTNSEAYIKSNSFITELHRFQNVISDINTKLEREITKPERLKVPHTITDLQNQLNQNKLALDNWKNNQKIKVLDEKKVYKHQKNTIESKIVEIERSINNSTIYAPISGIISETTKKNIGDFLLAGEEILRIVPQNSEILKADIYVDPRYIAKVKLGNPVRIKFPGLPPSQYGMIETKVSIIPPDVTYLNGTAVFIVEAQIDSPYLINKNNQIVKLIPGIKADGKIITDKSTAMQMLLKKLDFIN